MVPIVDVPTTRAHDWPRWQLGVAALVLVAVFSRLAYFYLLGNFIGADEAVGGLMALKIAQGQEFPLFLWEAHYAGALLSYFGAFAFSFFEPSPFIFRLAALPLHLVGVIACAAAARALWGLGPGLAAALWLALGPPLLFDVSAQAIGGYPEILCFGGLTFWLAVRLGLRPPRDGGAPREWAWLGAVGGFGTYSSTFVLPIFAGTLWTLRRQRDGLSRRDGGLLAAGFLLGFSPSLIYNVTHGGASILRLAGRVFDVSRAELHQSSSLVLLAVGKGTRYVLRLLKFPGIVLGNVPSFLGLSQWGTWAVAAAVLGAIFLARRHALSPGASPRDQGGRFGSALLGWCSLTTLVFIWILGLDAPRHLFPFYLLASLGLAIVWERLRGGWHIVRWGGLVLLLLSNLAGTMHHAREAGPRVEVLAKALHSRDTNFVYTDYFIAYPLIFLSRETILASPAAGPINVERHAAYTEAVAASPRPAYVFRRNTEASVVFSREMQRHGNAFSHEQIDEFDLYMPDRHIDPDELKLLRQF